ncbi:MAG: transglutaminase family protein [Dehalococcoidia bacterium]|nr:transglutaminase family protein [Dehalococcoidia bacterium]
MDRSLVTEFAACTAGPDTNVDLFGAAMVISRLRGAAVDPHASARELDLIADAVVERLGGGSSTWELIDAINHELFEEAGYHGNVQEYGDPENSYLDRVIARRTGIPISLSLVYMEVAQRVGLRADGVGYPGHFLVRCGPPEDAIFIDPFNRGARLEAGDLVTRLRGVALPAAPETYLSAVTRRQVLQRMLGNLHVIFRERRDLDRWLAVVELQLAIEPWNAQLVGERGMLHYRLGSHTSALADLERYVGANGPQAVSAGALRLLDELRLRYGGNEDEE